jgi:hypothetical protein
MARSGRIEGEVSVDEYRRLWADAIAASRDTLSEGRLLIPLELTHQCDRFFNSLFQGQRDLTLAGHPIVVDALQRAEFRDKAQTIAAQEVPSILDQIEKAARFVIHGEPPRLGTGTP